ncbi:hypothetical protein Afe05nite_30790 [Paractinoplanes ferrugineus]|uniref:Uncharacterized protein n=1 Tax=Paractinoplanes ferrugineus TaxID=113564 RepID=A0A919ME39_9ACTN|nr:hypothetical protein Afe05nite_30790 [Actinoplanes ferrugineus]
MMVGVVVHSGEAADLRQFGWFLGGTATLSTLAPQLFRRRAAFMAAAWTAIALIAVGSVLFVFFGACLFVPAVLMLVVAVLQGERQVHAPPAR